MSFEVLLFVVIGALAVAAAAAMLLTDNAVHSALFLILNFGCVAFFYLMLDAPFLAMVQIAVYAGAIMVLFLFVIMLLGAEREQDQERREFNWLAPLSLTLAMAFLIASSLAFVEGNINDQEPTPEATMLRVVNAAPLLPAVDVYLNGELFAEDVENDTAPEHNSITFSALAPGEYDVTISGEHPLLEATFPIGSITVEDGARQALIMYSAATVLGDPGAELGLPELAVISEDLTSLRGDHGRVTVFNAYSDVEALSLIRVGSDFIIDSDEEIRTFVDSLAYGEAVTIDEIREQEPFLAAVPADNTDLILRGLRDFTIEENVVTLLILAERFDTSTGELLVVPVPVNSSADASFGSPRAIGESLFIDYLLPFEVVALLLLASMVGAIVLTQHTGAKPKPGRAMRRKVSRPLTSVISSQTGRDVNMPDVPQLDAPSDTPEPAGDRGGNYGRY